MRSWGIRHLSLAALLFSCAAEEVTQKTPKETEEPTVRAENLAEEPTSQKEEKPPKKEVPPEPQEEILRWVKVTDDKVYLRKIPSGKGKFVGLARPLSALPVYEEVKGDGCKGKWLRVGPLSFPGYVCNTQTTKASAPKQTTKTSNDKDPTSRNGLTYSMVIKDVHLYDAPNGKELETIRPKDSYVTVRGEEVVGKETWIETTDGWLPKSALKAASAKGISALRGETLPPGAKLPWVFVVAKEASVYATPGDPTAPEIAKVKRFDRFSVLEVVELEDTTPVKANPKAKTPPPPRPKLRWARTDLGWIEGKKLDWALQQPRPEGVGPEDKWLFADLEQQTLVAYEGDQPVFTTIFSSGKAPNYTVTGTYRIHRVYRTHTMENAPGGTEESYYYVADIPFTMFFHKGFAIHGAFWHDNFGFTRSHGCVNMVPADAKWVYDWINPQLPMGWWGIALEPEDAKAANWTTIQVKWGDRVVKDEDVTNPNAGKIVEQMRALREKKELEAASQPAGESAAPTEPSPAQPPPAQPKPQEPPKKPEEPSKKPEEPTSGPTKS